jgi:sugar phosphate permease
MESKNSFDWTSGVAGFFCLLGSMAAGTSLTQVVNRFNGWQAVGYAVIAGIFIAFYTVIIKTMLQTLAEE